MAVSIGDHILYFVTADDVTNGTPKRAVVVGTTGSPPTSVTVRVLEPTPDDDFVVGSNVPAGIKTPQPTPVTLSRIPVAGQGVAQVPVQTASTPVVFAASIAAGAFVTDPASALIMVGNDDQRPGLLYAPDITGGELRPTTDHWRIHLRGEAFSAVFAGGESRVLGSATFGPGILPSASLGDINYDAGVITWTTWAALLDADISGSFEVGGQNELWFVRIVQNPAFPVLDKRQEMIGNSFDQTNAPTQKSGFARNIVTTFPNEYTIVFTNGNVGIATIDVDTVHVDFVLRIG